MKIIVTGGAGFIGSAVIRYYINHTEHEILNIDSLTYAGNLNSLVEISENPRYKFEHVSVCEKEKIEKIVADFQPEAVIHLAAESHVDRSIDSVEDFIQTNVMGTYVLLEAIQKYWNCLDLLRQQKFRFLHVSTDEVYGDLGNSDYFTEQTPYDPSSPYSASKASSDHLVRAWSRTYNLPVIVTNCSNNYGPFQFPEKLIPLMTINSIEGKKLPIYGDGKHVRDWLYVDDHVRALVCVVEKGKTGETYNIGSNSEKTNLEVVSTICDLLDIYLPDSTYKPHSSLITFVEDRPGHDKRYAIDASKIERELDWQPRESFESGIEKTVKWYLDNRQWWQPVLDGSYQRERLGLGDR